MRIRKFNLLCFLSSLFVGEASLVIGEVKVLAHVVFIVFGIELGCLDAGSKTVVRLA